MRDFEISNRITVPEERHVKAQDEVLGWRTGTSESQRDGTGVHMLLQLCVETVVVRKRCRRSSPLNGCRPSGTRIQNHANPGLRPGLSHFVPPALRNDQLLRRTQNSHCLLFLLLLPIVYSSRLLPPSQLHASGIHRSPALR